MSIKDMLLPEFDQEMAGVRKTLERVPENKPDFKPHEKSMTMARLAGHLAELPGWATVTLKQDELDMAPPGQPPMQPYVMTTRAKLLEEFDTKVAEARKAIENTTDQEFMKPWTLLRGGQKLLTVPKIGVMRSFVMNHVIHHRAQLGVYLRLNNVPVPSIYGPSADEGRLGG